MVIVINNYCIGGSMKKFLVLSLVLVLVFATVFVFRPNKTQAATAGDLATAFEVTGASSTSYSGNAQANGVVSSFGNIAARKNGNFSILSTGIASVGQPTDLNAGTDFDPNGTSGDTTSLTVNFTVPADMNSLLFDFYFLSVEYPEYVGTAYNDTFTATITGSSKVANGTNFAKDTGGNVIDINSVNFAVTDTHADLLGTQFQGHGGTGWLIAGAPVAPGDNVSLVFSVEDVEDGIYDSSVFLDNFRFDQGSVEAGVQSKMYFSQKSVNITDCTGRATVDLYSSSVTRSALAVSITNSDANKLALSTNTLEIPAYSSKTSNSLAMQGLKDGTMTLTASASGFADGTMTVNISGCPVLPATGKDEKEIIQFVNNLLSI